MKPIIEVRNISKQYKIGQKQQYLSLRDSVSDFFKTKGEHTPRSDFWALNDVSFDVQAGESIGIIGRNGAGKSTLLKILSRITPPTKGKIILRGRIASLLEVGTGFHSELTGRENVFMNGSILGLRRAEIAQKFDEIVAFSGVEQFIDTPLKHYSSGMQLRLAFAVAAHLEPEILVIDEVLAVGDADFQKKCLGKMDEVSKSGRTVLFVSHNMGAIRQLCHKGVILDKGKMIFEGDIQKAVALYEYDASNNGEAVWVNNIDTTTKMRLEKIEIRDKTGNLTTKFTNQEAVFIHFHTTTFADVEITKIGFDLLKDGMVLFRTYQIDSHTKDVFSIGENIIWVCKIPHLLLNNGEYYIRPLISKHNIETFTKIYDPVIAFNIETERTHLSYFKRYDIKDNPGLIFPILEWQFFDTYAQTSAHTSNQNDCDNL